MARLTMKISGRKGINWHVARHVDVQAELKAETDFAAFRAAGFLRGPHSEGHSYIETDKGAVDHYIVLNDERGQRAAMSIEFGRQPGEAMGEDGVQSYGGMEGKAPLRKAVGLL